jgi:hypothetical protein
MGNLPRISAPLAPSLGKRLTQRRKDAKKMIVLLENHGREYRLDGANSFLPLSSLRLCAFA